jgi:hypothetical protein
MVLTRQLHDATAFDGASNVKATIRHDLSLNPVQLRFGWPSVAPVLRTAAGVRPGPSAVESQPTVNRIRTRSLYVGTGIGSGAESVRADR